MSLICIAVADLIILDGYNFVILEEKYWEGRDMLATLFYRSFQPLRQSYDGLLFHSHFKSMYYTEEFHPVLAEYGRFETPSLILSDEGLIIFELTIQRHVRI